MKITLLTITITRSVRQSPLADSFDANVRMVFQDGSKQMMLIPLTDEQAAFVQPLADALETKLRKDFET